MIQAQRKIKRERETSRIKTIYKRHTEINVITYKTKASRIKMPIALVEVQMEIVVVVVDRCKSKNFVTLIGCQAEIRRENVVTTIYEPHRDTYRILSVEH